MEKVVGLVQNMFLLLTVAGIVYYFAHGFEEREKGTDFPDFYAAARMVREGYGHQLYDFQAQEKFQIRYAGRTVLLASLRRKGFVRGFALVFVISLLISVGISGWASLTAYPHFLMRLSSLPLAGIHPAAMANIRGLVSISGIVKNTAGLALIWIVSIWLLWYAWMSFKRSKSTFTDVTNLAFGNFVLAALLVSYHLSPTDLCIALLPIGLFSQYLAEHTGIPRWVRLSLLSSQCVLFLPPLHVISLAWHVYVYPIIPILIMFLLTSDENFRGIPRHVDRSDVISSFPAIS